jgi:hypothetical protein
VPFTRDVYRQVIAAFRPLGRAPAGPGTAEPKTPT